MTDAVTVLAQRNRLHSQSLHMESITINREDELFIWVLKADLACIVYYRSQADTAAEADDRSVISKEAVGNSWGILSPLLGHRYHQNHPDRNLQPKSEIDHICVFPYTCVCAINAWSRSSFRGTTCTLPPSWLSGIWVFFLSWTIHVITDFSFFKQYLKNQHLFSRVIKTLLPFHLFNRHIRSTRFSDSFASTQNVKLIYFNKSTNVGILILFVQYFSLWIAEDF